MIRRIDQLAGALVFLFGLLHLAIGHAVFLRPTDARVWFAAGGFLLVTTGLANVAAASGGSRMQSVAAASGSVAILVLGVLIARGDPDLLREPQTILLFAIGALLTFFRVRDIVGPGRIRPGRH